MDFYTELCKVAGTVHVSLVLDCFGNWCAAGRAFLEEIAMAKAALAPGVSTATHLLRLIQQCSVCLMLYNARTLHKAWGPLEFEATFACSRFDDRDDGESDSEDEGRFTQEARGLRNSLWVGACRRGRPPISDWRALMP